MGGSDMSEPLDASKENDKSDDDDEVGAVSWWYFHLMMLASALYMAMLLTDWSAQPAEKNDVPYGADAAGKFSVGLPSFWVKLVSQWVCILTYGWTLLAPYLLRETRDFGVEFDFD